SECRPKIKYNQSFQYTVNANLIDTLHSVLIVWPRSVDYWIIASLFNSSRLKFSAFANHPAFIAIILVQVIVTLVAAILGDQFISKIEARLPLLLFEATLPKIASIHPHPIDLEPLPSPRLSSPRITRLNSMSPPPAGILTTTPGRAMVSGPKRAVSVITTDRCPARLPLRCT
ncbi:hypothetical protein BC938DRAFT_478924, partial [Jimgerdemannia flammicorona]